MVFSAPNSYERFLQAAHKMVFAIDRNADRLLSESMGGTFTQFLVLVAIAQCPGLSQQKIAEFLHLTPAAISRQMDSLVEAKLIARDQDPHSRRSHVVSLTDAGTKRLIAMKSLLTESFKKIAPVDAEQLDVVCETMEHVLAALHTGQENSTS